MQKNNRCFGSRFVSAAFFSLKIKSITLCDTINGMNDELYRVASGKQVIADENESDHIIT